MWTPRLIAVLLVLCTPGAGSAQKHRLTDADVPRVVAALRAQIAARGGVLEAFDAASATADHQLDVAAEIRGGRVDAWTYIRGQTPQAMVPPGALHDAACSRQATGEVLVAAFSFGGGETAEVDGAGTPLTEEARTTYEAMLAHAKSQGPVTPERDEELRAMAQAHAARNAARSPGSRAAQGVHDARAFYLDAGFEPVDETTLRHPAEPSLTVHLHFMAPAFCPTAAAPMVVLYYSPAITAIVAAGERPARTLAEIAAENGWTEAEMSDVLSSVLVARADLEYPPQIDLAPPAEAELRRANMAVYQRHAATLGPLVEALMQF